MVLIDQQKPKNVNFESVLVQTDSKEKTPTASTKADDVSVKQESSIAVEAKEPVVNKRKSTVLEHNGYILGKIIGIGSYATVKLATSKRHGQEVAIKVFSKLEAPPDYLRKFLPREIEVVKGLRHPNLIRFLQAIETTHRVYIIMEYAERGSLLEFIQKDGYIQETICRKWFRQLVDAMDYCHDRGVVHRDIKCENLLIDAEFNMKLSDFGFARGHMRCSKSGNQCPLSDTFCGSYAYASPEILKGVPYVPHHSDVWSMGVVLYAMIFGRLPFDDTNYIQLLKQVQSKVVFPADPVVSMECKALLLKIFTPIKFRIRLKDLKRDSWLLMELQVDDNNDATVEKLDNPQPAGSNENEMK